MLYWIYSLHKGCEKQMTLYSRRTKYITHSLQLKDTTPGVTRRELSETITRLNLDVFRP